MNDKVLSDEDILDIVQREYGNGRESKIICDAIVDIRNNRSQRSSRGEPCWLNFLGQVVLDLESNHRMRKCVDEIANHYGYHLLPNS